MNVYADADRTHDNKLNRQDSIGSIFELLLEENPEMDSLDLMEMAISEFEHKSNNYDDPRE